MSYYFVGGSQRSGTTLLQTILCQDEAVNPLVPEAKYLRHLVAAYRFGKQTFGAETRAYFRDLQGYVLFNRNVVSLMLEQTRALYAGATHLCLREPHLTQYFPELYELLPDARFVCIVRDPRDVIASMVEVGARLARDGMAADAMARLFTSRRMSDLSAHYLSFYAPIVRYNVEGFRARCPFIRYEDLVERPAEYLGRLRELTGLALADYDPARAPDTGEVDYRQSGQYQRAWNSALYTSKVEDSRIGRYREVLTAEEVAEVDRACAEFMRRFGYAPGA